MSKSEQTNWEEIFIQYKASGLSAGEVMIPVQMGVCGEILKFEYDLPN